MKQYYLSKILEGYTVSVAGLSEIGNSKDINQDSFRIGISEEKQLAYIVVADGLGSCKYSDQGADRITDIAEKWIIKELPEYKVLNNIAAKALSSKLIREWRLGYGEKIDDYDTTVHVAIYYKGSILIGGIGDGMALIRAEDFICKDVIDETKHFSNVTNSMCSLKVEDLLQFEIIPLEQCVSSAIAILSTDGIADDLIPEKKLSLPEYFQNVLKNDGINALQNELIDWIVDWETESHSDDKTLCYMAISKEET